MVSPFQTGMQASSLQGRSPTQTGEVVYEVNKTWQKQKGKASERDPRRLPAFIGEKHAEGKELALNLTLHIHSSFYDTV